MRMNLTVITLGVRDFERSLAFYRDRLGWRALVYPEGPVAFLSLNGVVLALWPRHLLAQDCGLPDDGGRFNGISLGYNARSEAEVDEVLAQAVEAGATLLKPAHRTDYGGYNGYFTDLDGYLWEVVCAPGFKLDEVGRLVMPLVAE